MSVRRNRNEMKCTVCTKSRYVAFPILAFSHYLIRLISLYCGVSSLYLRYILRAFARERLLVPRTVYHERPGINSTICDPRFFYFEIDKRRIIILVTVLDRSVENSDKLQVENFWYKFFWRHSFDKVSSITFAAILYFPFYAISPITIIKMFKHLLPSFFLTF